MQTNKNRGVKSNLLPLYLKNKRIGKIHSKFNKGLNVQFEDSLIYISSVGMPLSAFGLNIDEDKLRQILYSTKINDVVVNKGGELVFYSTNEIINVDYKAIEEVNLKLPQIKCNPGDVSNTKLYNYLVNIDFQKYIGIELNEITCKYIKLLLDSHKSDSDINYEIIKFFSGRGKGLTPSGDDILTGFTLALMSFDNFNKFDTWIRSLKFGINKNRTTMISVAYIKALLEGYLSQNFIELVKLIDEEDRDVIERTIKKVQSFGHTSGNDTLFGFFLGLKFLIKQ